MRTGFVVIVGLIAGFFAGILLSALIGLVSLLLFDDATGIRFLPLYLAILGAVVAPAVARRVRPGSG